MIVAYTAPRMEFTGKNILTVQQKQETGLCEELEFQFQRSLTHTLRTRALKVCLKCEHI